MTTRGLLKTAAAGLATAFLVLVLAGCCTGEKLVFKSNPYKATVGAPLQLVVGHKDDTDGQDTEWGYQDRVSRWTVKPAGGAAVSAGGVFLASAPGRFEVWANDDDTTESGYTVVDVAASAAKSIYTNGNDSLVFNGGKSPSFDVDEQTLVTIIENYHYGEGKGTTGGGSIGLVSESGKRYGPWATETRAGQGGVPNAYWTASPGVVLPPGRYTVTDTDPKTWAQNAGSKGFGMTTISGTPVK